MAVGPDPRSVVGQKYAARQVMQQQQPASNGSTAAAGAQPGQTPPQPKPTQQQTQQAPTTTGGGGLPQGQTQFPNMVGGNMYNPSGGFGGMQAPANVGSGKGGSMQPLPLGNMGGGAGGGFSPTGGMPQAGHGSRLGAGLSQGPQMPGGMQAGANIGGGKGGQSAPMGITQPNQFGGMNQQTAGQETPQSKALGDWQRSTLNGSSEADQAKARDAYNNLQTPQGGNQAPANTASSKGVTPETYEQNKKDNPNAVAWMNPQGGWEKNENYKDTSKDPPPGAKPGPGHWETSIGGAIGDKPNSTWVNDADAAAMTKKSNEDWQAYLASKGQGSAGGSPTPGGGQQPTGMNPAGGMQGPANAAGGKGDSGGNFSETLYAQPEPQGGNQGSANTGGGKQGQQPAPPPQPTQAPANAMMM